MKRATAGSSIHRPLPAHTISMNNFRCRYYSRAVNSCPFLNPPNIEVTSRNRVPKSKIDIDNLLAISFYIFARKFIDIDPRLICDDVFLAIEIPGNFLRLN